MSAPSPSADTSILVNGKVINSIVNANSNSVITKLSVKYFNARSILSKLNSLYSILYCGDFNIICATETWLCAAAPDGLIDPICSYAIYRRDRLSTHPAGGVAILINSNIQSSQIDLHVDKSQQVEIVASSIHLNGSKLNIICVYIAPAVSIESFTEVINCLENVCALDGTTFILSTILVYVN